MNLTGIISISGKPGLYKVVAQAKNSIIVESLDDKKRVPAYATDRISALDDISIYTYSEDKPLKEIYRAIYDKENGGATLSHKEDEKKLRAYLSEILPDYDEERVYASDIKKLFQWYNLLHKSGNLVLEEEENTEEVAAESTEEAEAPKKAAAKKPAAKAPAKAAPAKKAPVKKKEGEVKAATKKKAPVKKGDK